MDSMIMDLQGASVPVFPSFGEPIYPPGGSSDKEMDTDRELEMKKVRVLVVDDEAIIADTVVEILKQEGFDAEGLSTGTSAIELAKEWHPDVLLSDVIMPGLNGIEIGMKIREIAPKCRVILFSGQAATVDLLEQARRQGHKFDILAKPIRPEQLIGLIKGKSPS
jgi:DNA-binding NtrC family response regulator